MWEEAPLLEEGSQRYGWSTRRPHETLRRLGCPALNTSYTLLHYQTVHAWEQLIEAQAVTNCLPLEMLVQRYGQLLQGPANFKLRGPEGHLMALAEPLGQDVVARKV